MVKVPKGYRSRNVQDRRGSRRSSGGGGGFGFPTRRRSSGGGGLGGGGLGGGGLGGQMGGGSLSPGGAPAGRRGCGGGMGMIVVLIVVVLLASQCIGGGTTGAPDLTSDGGFSSGGTSSSNVDPSSYSADEIASFDLVNAVLDDVQLYWIDQFEASGQTYPEAGLIVFDDSVRTGGCGTASSNVGPFYCPADSNAYIDIQFMFRLQAQLGAEGDFAQAYILAHEVGHHVQNVVGVNERVRRAQSGASRADSNRLQVYMELQADCLAGMWARHFRDNTNEILATGDQELIDNSLLLEEGDLNEGVRAAGAVGDDAITGSSNAENFTHGTSAQRVEWFTIGFEQESFDACWTFPDGAI